MSSDSYLKNALKVVDSFMAGAGIKMYKSTTPFHRQDYPPGVR